MLQAALPMTLAAADDLIALALALGARDVPGWSEQETALLDKRADISPDRVTETVAAIARGDDPLGDAYCRIYSADARRPNGATYTPPAIVRAMVDWAVDHVQPARVVDPGAGSARFLVAAGRRFPDASLIAVERDPLSAIIARGHLAAAGMRDRARVLARDYREITLEPSAGPTLFLGNPPYVRHHLIDGEWKRWLTTTARRRGLHASQLAGLHVHFFLATAELARPGDAGALITAAEWIDVNYGRLVRELLLGVLGARTIHLIEPTADPFPGTQATAVITGFEAGARPSTIGFQRVAGTTDLGRLTTDWLIPREQLAVADRWTPLTHPPVARREGFVELGELCRVHRGQVTGANDVWVTDDNPFDLPTEVLFPSITRAKELFAANGILADTSHLKRVIDLPVDLDRFDADALRRIRAFLKLARGKGADSGFIARHRKAWWSVGLRQPAPILASYMARRPPVFVVNLADARHINIAHGLYPRERLTSSQLSALAAHLSRSVRVSEGRTYAGGLTKFEPREMERLLVPSPALLADPAFAASLA